MPGTDFSLHKAASRGDVGCLKRYAEEGKDLGACDSYNRTPMHSACAGGRVSVVEFLIAKGAAVDPEDRSSRTPLHDACESGVVEVVALLLERKPQLLHARDHRSWVPLHVACWRGHLAIVQFLLQAGAKTTVRDMQLRTPLHLCCLGGHVDTVECMVKAGADLDVLDEVRELPGAKFDTRVPKSRSNLITTIIAAARAERLRPAETRAAAEAQPPTQAPPPAVPAPGSAAAAQPAPSAENAFMALMAQQQAQLQRMQQEQQQQQQPPPPHSQQQLRQLLPSLLPPPLVFPIAALTLPHPLVPPPASSPRVTQLQPSPRHPADALRREAHRPLLPHPPPPPQQQPQAPAPLSSPASSPTSLGHQHGQDEQQQQQQPQRARKRPLPSRPVATRTANGAAAAALPPRAAPPPDASPPPDPLTSGGSDDSSHGSRAVSARVARGAQAATGAAGMSANSTPRSSPSARVARDAQAAAGAAGMSADSTTRSSPLQQPRASPPQQGQQRGGALGEPGGGGYGSGGSGSSGWGRGKRPAQAVDELSSSPDTVYATNPPANFKRMSLAHVPAPTAEVFVLPVPRLMRLALLEAAAPELAAARRNCGGGGGSSGGGAAGAGTGVPHSAMQLQTGRLFGVDVVIRWLGPRAVEEALSATALRHCNLLPLLGICLDPEWPCAVYPYMPNGSLAFQLRREEGRRALPWLRRLAIAFQAVRAVRYLHEAQAQRPHWRARTALGPFPSSNLLLDLDWSVRLQCDSAACGSAGAPPAAAADMHGLGVTLLELLMGRLDADAGAAGLAARAAQDLSDGALRSAVDPLADWPPHVAASLACRALGCAAAAASPPAPLQQQVPRDLEVGLYHLLLGCCSGGPASLKALVAPACGPRCALCMSQPRETRFVPCLHSIACRECASYLYLEEEGCPIEGCAIRAVEFVALHESVYTSAAAQALLAVPAPPM